MIFPPILTDGEIAEERRVQFSMMERDLVLALLLATRLAAKTGLACWLDRDLSGNDLHKRMAVYFDLPNEPRHWRIPFNAVHLFDHLPVGRP